MSTIVGVFNDSKKAGDAVAELKNKGYTNDISVISKDVNGEGVKSEQVKDDVTDGAVAGAAVGGALAGLATLLAGAAALAIPGAGILILGPLGAALAGAATGGLVGALVDWGIPQEKAKEYEHRIKSGDVLVAVKTNKDKEQHVLDIFKKYRVDKTNDFTLDTYGKSDDEVSFVSI